MKKIITFTLALFMIFSNFNIVFAVDRISSATATSVATLATTTTGSAITTTPVTIVDSTTGSAISGVNIALNKTITVSGSSVNNAYSNDGQKDSSNYTNMDAGSQWLQVDLGGSYDLNKIKFWHYFKDGRTYKDVVVQISVDKDFKTDVKTVFNNDQDNSSGLVMGTDSEYAETVEGKEVSFNVTKGRYVRFYSNGSTANAWNHYVEIEVYGLPNSVVDPIKPIVENTSLLDVASSKVITSSTDLIEGTYANDGQIDTTKYTTVGSGSQWIEIDLGQYYDITKVKFWHYFGDVRTYKDVVVQISGDPDFAFTAKTVFNNDQDNSTGLGIGSDSEYIETKDGKEVSFSAKKGRYVRLYSNGNSLNEWNNYTEIEVCGTVSTDMPARRYNVSLNKSVTASSKISAPNSSVDGVINNSIYADLGVGSKWIQLDLGQKYDISSINLWHYFNDGRTYKDVIVQLSNNSQFNTGVSTVFNNDNDNSSKQEIGKDSEYVETRSGKTIFFEAQTARYVRFWSNGSTVNSSNHYTEIEVYGFPTYGDSPSPENLALNKTVTSSTEVVNPIYVNDGNIDFSNYSDLGPDSQWLQFDLNNNYNIVTIKLWHYFNDSRSYHDVIVQVSNDPTFVNNVKTIFNNDNDNSSKQGIGTDLEYTETPSGKEITLSNAKGRYVRIWSNGSTVNVYNHYVDVQIFEKTTKPIIDIPVLMYHSIQDVSTNIYELATKDFDDQMKYLKDNGYTPVSLDQYYSMIKKISPKVAKPIVITFDDGFLDNYTIATPILKKYGFNKATFFVPSGFIDKAGRVTTGEVKQMAKDGYDIAGHGVTHERLEDYNYDEQYQILKTAKEQLEAITNKKVNYFAYPYGSFNSNTISILNTLGYKTSFSSIEGFSTRIDSPYVEKRVFVSGGISLADFADILQ